MHFIGLAGMPRRIPDYSTQFTDWNMIISIGGFAFRIESVDTCLGRNQVYSWW